MPTRDILERFFRSEMTAPIRSCNEIEALVPSSPPPYRAQRFVLHGVLGLEHQAGRGREEKAGQNGGQCVNFLPQDPRQLSVNTSSLEFLLS